MGDVVEFEALAAADGELLVVVFPWGEDEQLAAVVAVAALLEAAQEHAQGLLHLFSNKPDAVQEGVVRQPTTRRSRAARVATTRCEAHCRCLPGHRSCPPLARIAGSALRSPS